MPKQLQQETKLSPNHQIEPVEIPEASEKVSWKTILPRVNLVIGRHISIGVGEDALQFASVDHWGYFRRLADVSKVYFPADKAGPVELENFIANEISEYLASFGKRRHTTSLVLSGPETALRIVTLPGMSKRDLDSAIIYQAETQLPFPADTALYDYRVLARQEGVENGQVRVALVGCAKQLVDRLLLMFTRIGREVDQIYFAQDVIGHLLNQIEDFSDERVNAVINIERNRTEIAYYKGSELEFSHNVSIGSSFLADRTDPTVFDYFSESLATEIQNSLDFYTGQYSSQFSDHIFVYGDLAFTDELIDRLTERFGFAFSRIPTERLRVAASINQDMASALPVSLAAVAAADCTSRTIDLLPAERKQRRFELFCHRCGIAMVSILACILLLGWFFQRSTVQNSKQEVLELQRQVDNFKNSPAFYTYNLLKQQIAIDQTYLDRIKQFPSYFGLNLKQLTILSPPSIRILSFTFSGNKAGENMELIGRVRHATIPPELILAEYVEGLESSPFYSDVRVKRYVKKKESNFFELEFQIKARAVI